MPMKGPAIVEQSLKIVQGKLLIMSGLIFIRRKYLEKCGLTSECYENYERACYSRVILWKNISRKIVHFIGITGNISTSQVS